MQDPKAVMVLLDGFKNILKSAEDMTDSPEELEKICDEIEASGGNNHYCCTASKAAVPIEFSIL